MYNASSSLSARGINSDGLRSRFLDVAGDHGPSGKDVIAIAIGEAKRLGHINLDGGHILLALIHDPHGECTRFLQSMDVDVAVLRREIESRLPQPSFPLDKAMAEFADHAEVRRLQHIISDAQSAIESHVERADFETAALHRDRKVQTSHELQSLFERLWHNAHR